MEKQLLDYYLIPEILTGCAKGYGYRVYSYLTEHSFHPSVETIYRRCQQVISGNKILQPAADVDGRPSNRDGKDLCYAGIWTMIELAIPCKEARSYVGLPANQLDSVRKHCGPFITACERDTERTKSMKLLAKFLQKNRPFCQFKIENQDIFNFLKITKENQFNIFDLDLMCILPKTRELAKWAKVIHRTAKSGNNVVNITATIGRDITEEQHKYRVEILRDLFVTSGFKEEGYSRFCYRDRQTPMRSERFILRKRR
jgi:hypothetical protein